MSQKEDFEYWTLLLANSDVKITTIREVDGGVHVDMVITPLSKQILYENEPSE